MTKYKVMLLIQCSVKKKIKIIMIITWDNIVFSGNPVNIIEKYDRKPVSNL